MARFSVLSCLVFLTVFSGCGVDKEKGILMAAGSFGDLAVVISDPGLRPATDRFLSAFNPDVTFVIKPEPMYKVDVFEAAHWELAKGYKNALILVRIGSGNAVEKQARRLVSRDAWQQMEAAGGGIVQLEDPWATYQLAVVVAAKDVNSLSSILRNNPEKLRGIFDESNRLRILRRNRHEGLQTGLMDAYWRQFGFYMEIPAEFRQNQLKPKDFPGLELMCNSPSRGISVSWRDTPDPEAALADRDVLTAIRAEMGSALHKEEIVPESFVWSADEVGGRRCVKLEGAWNSLDFAGGGPFWCWFIPDPERSRVFCVDLLVYGPGMDKAGYFRRMEAVLSTFSTRRPQS